MIYQAFCGHVCLPLADVGLKKKEFAHFSIEERIASITGAGRFIPISQDGNSISPPSLFRLGLQ